MHAIARRGASTTSGMLQTERLVLFPYGQPTADDARERCAEFLLRQRGDLRRIIDTPCASVERFCAHLRRIEALRGNTERPLVVLTRPDPIASSLIQTRTRMERALPILRRATWAVLVDRARDPLFEITARQLGDLQFDTSHEGTWTAPHDSVFIVVCVGAPSTERFDLAG